MKILLTGATGFLGSHLLRSLIENNHEVVVVKRATSDCWRIEDLLGSAIAYNLDEYSVEKIFAKERPSVIIHTACLYGKKGESKEEVEEVNVNFGLDLLAVGLKNGLHTFINTDTLLPAEINDYAKAKSKFREHLFSFSPGLQVINFRIEFIYGPYDGKDKFLPWLMHQLIHTDNDIPLTSGEQERDFIYIDDVVSAYISVLGKMDILELHNKADLTSGRLMKLKEFILIVAREIAEIKKNDPIGRLKFGSITNREGEAINLDLDGTLIQKINWNPKVNFETGIKKIIEKDFKD